MAQSVNVNFRMDEQLKKVEEIYADPFYSESNIRYLKNKLDALNAGTLPLEEHDLIEVD